MIAMARLSKEDWLDHGLSVLSQSGPGGLKAEVLAKSLNVSRGSFYWHFKDIDEFHFELLAYWQQRATADIIALVEKERSPSLRLGVLMRIGMTGSNALERNVRSWAAQSIVASEAVVSVDEMRIEYLARLLRSAGVPRKQARARATFIYWAYAGRVMVSKEQSGLSEAELNSIAALLQFPFNSGGVRSRPRRQYRPG
jgi:AcrR family transcriptional regulator